jgi:cobalamin biosynthesis protein CbiG
VTLKIVRYGPMSLRSGRAGINAVTRKFGRRFHFRPMIADVVHWTSIYNVIENWFTKRLLCAMTVVQN